MYPHIQNTVRDQHHREYAVHTRLWTCRTIVIEQIQQKKKVHSLTGWGKNKFDLPLKEFLMIRVALTATLPDRLMCCQD